MSGVLPGAGSLRCSAPVELRVSLAISLSPYLGAQLPWLLCCPPALTAFGPGTQSGEEDQLPLNLNGIQVTSTPVKNSARI